MADVFSGRGVGDHDAPVAIAVGDIEAVGLGIDHDIGGLVEDRRAIDAAILVVAGEGLWRAAHAHLEIAVHVELQDEAVGAQLVGGPWRARAGTGCFRPALLRRLAAIGGVAADPDVIVGIDIDAMLVARPDAAVGSAAVPVEPARIGRPAPGAQQLAGGIEFQHRGRSHAAVGARPVRTFEAQAVDGNLLAVQGTRHRWLKPGFVIGQAARAVENPYMVVTIDEHAADLAQEPVMRERLGPGGIDHELGRAGPWRLVPDAGIGHQAAHHAALRQDAGVGRESCPSHHPGARQSEPDLRQYAHSHPLHVFESPPVTSPPSTAAPRSSEGAWARCPP